MCGEKFPDLICRPIAAVQMDDNAIALMLFEKLGNDIKIASERHYRLVDPSQVTIAELRAYNSSST